MKPVKDAKKYREELRVRYLKWAKEGEALREKGLNMVQELEDLKIGLDDADLVQKIDDAVFAAYDTLNVFLLDTRPSRLYHPKTLEEITSVNEAINKLNQK